MTRIIVAVIAAAVTIAPLSVGAQGNISSAASAMGGNYTALARNFNAIAWNPANLGLPGNARFSLAILSPQFGNGTGPVTFSDLNEYSGRVVPVSVRNAWLQRITDSDGQQLGGDADITALAISVGPVAVSAMTSLRATGSIPSAVAELLFFGNAGRTGSASNFAFDDLKLDANATSTIAASYGKKFLRIPLAGEFAFGVTGKYIIGHAMASMRDNGSTLTSSPVSVSLDAPMVLTDTSTAMNGSGFGIDIGAGWSVGEFRFGAALQNVLNTFAWKTDDLYYMPVRATFNGTDSDANIEAILPLSSASPTLQEELRSRIDNSTPQPTLALGGAYTGFPRLTLSADLRRRFGDGLELGPRTHIGVGAELRVIPFVPLRAGVTSLTGGMRYSTGLGL